MKKKLIVGIGMMVVMCVFLGFNLIANTPSKIALIRIPQEERIPALMPGFTPGGGNYCEIANDEGVAIYNSTSFDSGKGIAVYMDPTKCVTYPYPFKITDVHLALEEGPSKVTYLWPVSIQVNVREVSGGNKCNGPGSVLCSKNYSIPSDSSSARLLRMMNLSLSPPCCVTSPFFLEIKYLSKSDTFTLPSLLMDDTVATGPDTCINWFLDTLGYHSWVDHWGDEPPGDALIRATGYYCSLECESLWYWKPDTTHAPSGMLDFDQYQFGQPDSQYLDGPTAVANCLWWFGAVPQGTSPPNFIRLLSTYFHAKPDSGTYVDSIEAGLDRYFRNHGYNYYEHTFVQPKFHEMEDSLKKCQDIILLLGFYQQSGGDWIRFGGHYVTMAGVCSDSLKIALSDPFRDAAENGWPGRVRPPDHPAHPGNPKIHNDSTFICHDIYLSDTLPPTPGNPHWGLTAYNVPDKIYLFDGKNFQDGQKSLQGSYIPGLATYTEVEYAIMICPKAPDSCWYWKKDTTQAPSGMPDFDQYQFGADTSALCGPTAVANCLRWFNAVPSGVKSDSLIKLLSKKYFHTRPDSGTYVDTIKLGLDQYFAEHNYLLKATTFTKPDFHAMQDSLKKCQDIILLLGFWQQDGSTWYRVGGHFVTMAGVCSTSHWVALSDPARNAAEGGWTGRVRPPVHPSHPLGDTLHNDPQYVSHDTYWASLSSPSPGGIWSLPDYPDFQPILPFVRQNCQPNQWQYVGTYNPSKPTFTEVEYAVMICPVAPETSWYWKPDTTHAPSGMPDFDQHQFAEEESSAMCGPTAVANCLWWFNVVPVGVTPPGLIRLLSKYYFHTRPDSGTYVDSIKSGLNRYFRTYGYYLKATTFKKPAFYEMEDSLKKCQDIILLLGFWQWNNGVWYRVGGHYLTMAGVCSESTKVALSDPARDAAENGWPGRVRPLTHHSHPDNPFVHNDSSMVCHDIYWAFLGSPSPGGAWSLPDYPSFADIHPFEGQNFQPDTSQHFGYYVDSIATYAEVEYAIMVCRSDTFDVVEGEEGAMTPKDFELYQNHPNPFNNETVIKFNLLKPSEVTLVIYNILGEKVRTLAKGHFGTGLASVGWDGKDEKGHDLASGIYFYQLKAGEATQTKRLLLLK